MNTDINIHRLYHTNTMSMEETKEWISESTDEIKSHFSKYTPEQWEKRCPSCIFCNEEYQFRLRQKVEHDLMIKEYRERDKRQQEEIERLKQHTPDTLTTKEEAMYHQYNLEKEEQIKIITKARGTISLINDKISKLNLPDVVIVKSVKFCGICQVSTPDKDHQRRHLESHAHKVKAGIIQVETYPKTCEPCGYEAKTKNTWDIHCKGKKHKLKVTNIETEEVVKVD